MTSRRTTSSNALLGLLALRTRTAYELTHQVRRSLRWVWPRSEASIYTEIRRLHDDGLAHATQQQAHGRTRTSYEITDAGRDAVTAWLRDTDPIPPQVQIEQVLRVFFADIGTPEDLHRSLNVTRQQVTELLHELEPVIRESAGPDALYPGRAHLDALFIHFMVGFYEHVLSWCDDVETELDTWDGTGGAGLTAGLRQMLDDALAFCDDIPHTPRPAID